MGSLQSCSPPDVSPSVNESIVVVPSSDEVEPWSPSVVVVSSDDDELSEEDDGVIVAVTLLGVWVVKSVGVLVLVVAPAVKMLSAVSELPVVAVRLPDDDTVSCEHDIIRETRRT